MVRSTIAAAALLGLAGNAAAAAMSALVGEEATTNLPGVVLVGAANPTKASVYRREAEAMVTDAPVIKPRLAAPPEYLTITFINSHGSPISTQHVHDPSAPAAVSGYVSPGTMANGATAAFAVPTGWIGNVAFADAAYEITGDDTLLEGNFIVPDGYDFAVADIDVSYVNGMTLAITCSCSGTVVTGCNKNLWLLNTCGDEDGQGACVNPLRADEDATAAAPFFAPCEHAAWTYVNDDAANSFGQCQSGQVTCCVGASCPADPKQS
ncbi:hypothetical protein BX600DRAFT_488573 [Xylariales sp. PMI_506]|nr:hypothetical protein BX600DRAFT_488573 [Xylariales sp. PMI_506]